MTKELLITFFFQITFLQTYFLEHLFYKLLLKAPFFNKITFQSNFFNKNTFQSNFFLQNYFLEQLFERYYFSQKLNILKISIGILKLLFKHCDVTYLQEICASWQDTLQALSGSLAMVFNCIPLPDNRELCKIRF